MRILVLSPWGLHGGYSGPLTLLDRLMGAVAEHDVRIDVAYRHRVGTDPTPGRTRMPEWVGRAYPLVRGREGAMGRAEQTAWIARATSFLARRGRSYDVVHLHGGYLSATAPLLALGPRPKATTVVLPVLEGGDLGLPPSGPTRVLKRQTVRLAGTCDVGLALSEGIAAELRMAGVPTDRVRRIFNPVPADLDLPSSPRCIANGQVRLGFLGRLTETKRPHAVIEAVAELRRGGLDAQAVLIGPDGYDRAYADRLRRLPEELEVEKWVQLTGLRTDAVSLLSDQADVFVLPSSAEGLPGALAEALACGLPAVVTDVGAMGAVAAESGAAVVTDGTPADIAAGVQKALACHRALSANALSYARAHLSPQSVAQAYLSAVTKDRP